MTLWVGEGRVVWWGCRFGGQGRFGLKFWIWGLWIRLGSKAWNLGQPSGLLRL